MWELSVAEQRHQAALAVIVDGVPITEVAAKVRRDLGHLLPDRFPTRGG
jgi:hypothetical protein